MKKYVKDLLQHQLAAEEEQLKELKKIYQRAIRDCDEAIRQLSARPDMENLQSIIYQKQYQEALKKQLEGIVDQLSSRQFTSVSQYLNECYVNGYVGNAYALMKQGIPLLLPIDQEKVVRAVKTDSKLSKGLYAALGEDVGSLKKAVRMQLSRGIASGKNWHQVADELAGDFKNTPFNKAYNRSMTIVRTEGHRISEAAIYDGMCDAKAAGADVVKQWVSVLDGVTRPNHRTLDGQIRELEEPYEVDNLQAMYPGAFGVAKEDCNCRCVSTQRAKWSLDESELAELKSRADFWGLDKSQEFEEFKEKYLQATVSYEGIPKTWTKLKEGSDVLHVNPQKSNTNCVNCTIAYEMRKRGYAVVAGKENKNLQRDPFSGWDIESDDEINTISADASPVDQIENALKKWGEGSRCQITIIYKNDSGIFRNSAIKTGHSFLAELRNNHMIIIDPQNETIYNKDKQDACFSNAVHSEIRYMRIDNREINDRGSHACMKEQE